MLSCGSLLLLLWHYFLIILVFFLSSHLVFNVFSYVLIWFPIVVLWLSYCFPLVFLLLFLLISFAFFFFFFFCFFSVCYAFDCSCGFILLSFGVSFWCHFGCHFGVMLGSCWGHFGVFVRSLKRSPFKRPFLLVSDASWGPT